MSLVIEKYADSHKPEENSVDLSSCNNNVTLKLFQESIDRLSLSVRLKNVCKDNKIYTLQDFLNVDDNQWMKFPNFGQRSLYEVQGVRNAISSHEQLNKIIGIKKETLDGSKDNEEHWQKYVIPKDEIMMLPIDLFKMSIRAWNALKADKITTIGGLLAIKEDDFLKIPNFGKKSLQEIREIKDIIFSPEQLNKIIIKITGEENIDGFFEDLSGFTKELSDDIQKSIYIQRIKATNPSTLQYFADVFDLTRERVRQIESKIINKLVGIFTLHAKSFKKLFDKYGPIIKFTVIEELKGHEEYFPVIINCSNRLPFKIYPKEKIFCNRSFDIESFDIEASEDVSEDIIRERVSEHLKSVIKSDGECLENFNALKKYFLDKFLNNKVVFFEKNRIPANRFAIIKIFLKTYCRDTMEFAIFFDLYKKTMIENGFWDNKNLIFDENTLLRSMLPSRDDIIWTTGRKLRYFAPEQYENLFKQINLKQYKNKEISSKKIFSDYSDLMREYDVRNEYELHNLMKKMLNDNSVVFGRMPTLSFGNSNREQQVRKLLLELAPISPQDLADAYKEAYGVETNVFHANYAPCVLEFYKDGIYDVSPLIMPDRHIETLKNILTKDFYWIDDVEKIYTDNFADANPSFINTYNFDKIGYNIASTYVFSKKFKTFEAYIKHWIGENKVINIQDNRNLRSLGTFYVILAEMKKNLDLIEFQKDRYIKIKELYKVSVTKDDLYVFIKNVKEFVEDKYFTIQSLRNDGFSDQKLEDLGFEDFFYASILSSDNNFQAKRLGGTFLIKRDTRQINIPDFLTFIMGNKRRMDVYDLMTYLYDRYGLLLDRQSILAYVRDSELYYNEIMDKIYINYDEFFNSEL